MKNKIASIICLLFILLSIGSCGKGDKNFSITIAEQYGLAYAPLQIMKSKGFLEELRPGVKVNWVRLANTAAIREAVLAGEVDAGFLGIPPLLIARDRKMPWKIATGLSRAPLGLVVPDEKIRRMEDIASDFRIALPQPGSIQHILLSMALDREYSDPAMLDSSLVSMKHPDGMNALLSGAVQGHFTSPPYIFQETRVEGFSLLLSGEEAFGGPFTFIVGMATEDFYRNHPDLYEDYLKAVDQSITYLYEHPEESLKILSDAYGMDEDQLEEYLFHSGLVFETDIRGVDRFISFMLKTGMIREIRSAGDVIF